MLVSGVPPRERSVSDRQDRDDRLRRWFGPRRLASIVFAIILIDDAHLPHLQTLLLAITVMIAISVYAHGLTAGPLTERYVRWWTSRPRDAKPAMEDVPANEHRLRRPVTRPDVARGVDEAGAQQR